MVSVFLYLLAFVWLIRISRSLYSRFQIRIAIGKLTDFLIAFGRKGIYASFGKDNYCIELTSALRYYPVIQKYAHYPDLSYNFSDEKNRDNAETLLGQLQMLQNFKTHELLSSLNPFSAAKETIFFPITLLNWLGFSPGKIPSLFLTLAGWLISHTIDIFSPEIRAFILSLFQ